VKWNLKGKGLAKVLHKKIKGEISGE